MFFSFKAMLGLFIVALVPQAFALQGRQAPWEATDLSSIPQWPGESASLDEDGYTAVAATTENTQMWRFIRRVASLHGAAITDEDALRGLVPFYSGKEATQSYAALLEEMAAAKWLKGYSADAQSSMQRKTQSSIVVQKVNLFVAGVEGTGHHFAKLLMDGCIKLGRCLVDPELTSSLWTHRDNKTALQEAWRSAAVRELEEPVDTVSAPKKLRILNTPDITDQPDERTYAGMMSYPSFGKDIWPRLDLYNEVAHESGDELRVLVLLRDPRAVLCSDYSRWHHSKFYEELALNKLIQQLQSMDPSTYQCLDYDNLPNVPAELEVFMGRLFQTEGSGVSVADLVAQNYQESHSACGEAEEESPGIAEKFMKAQAPLLELCRQAAAAVAQ